MKALHFVNFKDLRYQKDERAYRAVAIFGQPDFWHRRWDVRAMHEIAPGDVVVFANGTINDLPATGAFDDSAIF